jgi:molecular chaperone DnaK
VQQAVRSFFGKEPRRTVNPDEAMALGAAVQAALLEGEVEGITLSDVTPLSLGVERHDGTTSVLVPRNSPVPARVVRSFSTAVDNQAAVEIHVVQGEAAQARDNRTLGRFALENVAGGEAGEPEIQVTFKIDVNGIVAVEARDRTTGSFRAVSLDAREQPGATSVPGLAPAPAAAATSSADQALRGAAKVLELYRRELAAAVREELEQAARTLEALRGSGDAVRVAEAERRLNDLTVRAVKSMVSRR